MCVQFIRVESLAFVD